MTVIQGGTIIPGAQKRVFQGVTDTVGAEATNVINVSVQLDEGGNNLAARGGVITYLSDNANGDGVSATAPTGGVVIGTNGFAAELITDKVFMVTANATGAFDLDITDTGTPTFYLVVILPNGELSVSGAITFA